MVIWCAMLASKKGAQMREFKKGVLPFILVLGLVSLLILLEPNLSMATLVALLGGLVLFTSGAKIGHFILLGGVARDPGLPPDPGRAVPAGPACSRSSIRATRRREAGFQIHQSLVGIGSGGIFGTGFGQGQQKLGYLPYAYSDFLFSTIGEEWGFVGVLVVVSLFALFCWLGFRIARTAAGPVRAVSRRRAHGHDRAHRVHAHGGVARTDADDRDSRCRSCRTDARAR